MREYGVAGRGRRREQEGLFVEEDRHFAECPLLNKLRTPFTPNEEIAYLLLSVINMYHIQKVMTIKISLLSGSK